MIPMFTTPTSMQPPAVTKDTPLPRRYDLDWIRILAFGLLIFYHTGMFFVSWEWHIKNNRLCEGMELPMQFSGQWRMSLLFLVSGAATYFALDKFTAGRFLRERTLRIFLPLAFGIFVIVPPQIYFERLTQGATFSYAEFYGSVFQFISYPQGSFSWHHLWYLAYLFVYSLVFLPLFIWLKRPSGQMFLSRLSAVLVHPVALYGVALIHFAIEILLRDRWETTHNLIADWYNHALSASFFLIGFLVCTQSQLAQQMQRLRRWSLGMGVITLVLMLIVYWIPEKDIEGLELVVYRALKSFNRWFWILAILGYGKHYLSFNSPFLKYANEAVYPFYILHQTVIICIAYPMIHWDWPVAIKFLVISTGTFLICWFLYTFLIRSTKLMRLLFGLKV